MTMQTIAQAFADSLVQATRDDGTTYFKLADGAPQWMSDAIEAAHDGRMPNDRDYSAASEIADAIAEALADGSDLDEVRYERLDGLVPIYNHERTEWLAAHSDHVVYCDDAREQGMVSPDADLLVIIGTGMYAWYEQKWNVMLDAITEQASDEDDSNDEA